jgi:spermidine synthase
VRLGVVGLGIGTLSAYGRAGDVVRFYELDPDVVDLAWNRFWYLKSSPATLEFALGDARLSMERELKENRPQRFDVLAIDAFSSDSIPVHLITKEAIEIYARQIAPDGIIAVHISNRFLDLKPVLANIGAATGLAVRNVADAPSEESGASSTDWVLIAQDTRVFDDPLLAERVEAIAPRPEFSLWTDQFNNLLDVLKTRSLTEIREALFD